MTSGRVSTITPDRRGDTLLTATAEVDAVLEVEDTTDFDEDGGWLVIADSAPIAYTGLDDDAGTLTLADPVGEVFEAGLPVDLWDPTVPPTGAKVVEYVATVDVGHGVVPGVTIPHELVPSAGVDNLVAASVAIDEDGDDDWYIAQVFGREPVVDLSTADASTLDVDALPAIPLTDGDAPDNAPTVTPIGGIGSMFFRWTEITNADPVTYRLHVRAGSAPTTDGTYEVAAGVGLTQASVRKLADGTAIVGDGSVTYHAVVTVEDADGPGPASTDVTGIPAQVTGPDIAVGAVTTDELVFNSGWGAELTGETVTGATVRTSASGQRVELSSLDYVRFYSGHASEQLPGYVEADVVGNLARLVLAAPDTDESNKAQTTYRNMILLYEDATDASATRTSRTMTARTAHFYFELAGGGLVHIDGTSGDPNIDLDNAHLTNFVLDAGTVGAGSFRDSVDSRVSTVAPTVTMTTGSVGTGAFRDSVDARADARSAARMQVGAINSGTLVAATSKTVSVTFPTAFSVAPTVVVSPRLGAEASAVRRCSVVDGSETTTGFQVNFWRDSGTAAFDANWIAVKP